MRNLIVFIAIVCSSFCFAQNAYLMASMESGGAVVDLFPTGNAASSDDANATTGWSGGCSTSCIEILSVANTDGGGGGSYAISIEHVGGSESFRYASIDLTGLSLTPHTLTIRTRRVSGVDGYQGIILSNTTSVTNNVDWSSVSTGTWFESTIEFTPTSSTVNFRVDVNRPGSGQGSSGKIEISRIILEED